VIPKNVNPEAVTPIRKRKTDLKSRQAIVTLYQTGDWSMSELAKKFEISIPRVCQIVKQYSQ
tara:strand:- start:1593 stop:1778 length:186 start_codon:yes stop_codon:yes gene_type:complete